MFDIQYAEHSISDKFMLKSNHLKHLHYLYYVLRNLTVCVYRERDTCCLGTQVMVNFSLTVLAAISSMNVNLFC